MIPKPLTKDEFYERHSAYFQQIGFDVQFAGCMYYLISLGDTDTLEYETKDDFVVYRTENGEKITEYFQVKHTKDVGANMTDADGDFWKSIDNWIEAYKLHTPDEKKTYFTKGDDTIEKHRAQGGHVWVNAPSDKDYSGGRYITPLCPECNGQHDKHITIRKGAEYCKELGASIDD